MRPRDNDIGLLFTGYLSLRRMGITRSYLSADTGASLRIHEATVIDADYGYAGGEISGSIKLKAGMHPFRLCYIRRGDRVPSLTFSWSGPGFSKQPVTENALRRDVAGAARPAAQNDSARTEQDVPISIDVLANDSDDGMPSPLTLLTIGQPRSGRAVINAGQILYMPDSNFLGEDWFAYTISDGQFTARRRRRSMCFSPMAVIGFLSTKAPGLSRRRRVAVQRRSWSGLQTIPRRWVAGKFNQALRFDGVSQQVVVDGFKGIGGSHSRTVSAWIKTIEANNSIAIVSWGDISAGGEWTFLVQNSTEPKGTLRLDLGDGDLVGGAPVNDGRWHHVACVLDSVAGAWSTNIQFYVDGRPDAAIGGAPVAVQTATQEDVLIGSDRQNHAFKGAIDEVRIYDHALTAAEVAGQYNATKQSAVAWHRRYFGDGSINWNSDSDGDGVSRLGEYAFGGQPHIADSENTKIDPEIAGDHLLVGFNRRTAGSAELIYEVQGSPDLARWSLLSGADASVAPSATLPGFERVIFRAEPTVEAESPLFVRILVRWE